MINGKDTDYSTRVVSVAKKVYPNLVPNDVLGIQQLTSPTGQIYNITMDYGFIHKNPHKAKLEGHLRELKRALGDFKDPLNRRRCLAKIQKIKTDIKHHKKRFPQEYI